MSMFEKLISRGGLWVIWQMALLLCVFGFGPLRPGSGRSALTTLPGILLILVGSACGIAGTLALGRNLTPLPQPAADARLVRHGIYRVIRHPLYAAVMCASIGWALLWASWPSLLAAAILIPFLDAKARREERWLRVQFPEYADYERRVKRFLPFIY
jgi:protein-S-isoprenylcysteine O-methyltransferase Ste14